MDEVVDRNMKDAVDFAVHFFEENHVRRVLIGGSDENVSLFRGLLPKNWQNQVVGTFTLPMTASNLEVRNMVLRIGTAAAEKTETDLVEQVLTHAAKQNGAVTGMQATYHAINQDRVMNLVFVEDLRKEAFVCSQCGALFAEKAEDLCPQCGSGKLERTLDGIELAVNTVMRRGGEVTVVKASSPLGGVQGIGAVLRY
jgi:peptide subunit release factor 1 (eRF1)